MIKLAVTMATIESHNHITGDIECGVKIFNNGGVEYASDEGSPLGFEPNTYLAKVPHKKYNETKAVRVTFSKDGQDITDYFCGCTLRYGKNAPICRHVVAAVLAIQGGITESAINIGISAKAKTVVVPSNTAKAVGSGSLEVFSTPMMIALMEEAACNCIADGLELNQTSLGTQIDVSHTAASPIGAEITATAAIERVYGRKIEFKIAAFDGEKEIGSGTHTRIIIDSDKFMKKVRE